MSTLQEKIRNAHQQFLEGGTLKLNEAKLRAEETILRNVKEGERAFKLYKPRLSKGLMVDFSDWLRNGGVTITEEGTDPSDPRDGSGGDAYWLVSVTVVSQMKEVQPKFGCDKCGATPADYVEDRRYSGYYCSQHNPFNGG